MFRIVEHTADLAIEAEGATAGECLSAAAQALACIVTGRDDLHGVRPEDEVVFEVKAPDLGALAVAFLSEVLWFLEEESVLWISGGADVEPLDMPAGDEPWSRASGPREPRDWVARARANAVMYSPAHHGQGTEVKAITYNQLRFGPVEGRWRLYVVVDI